MTSQLRRRHLLDSLGGGSNVCSLRPDGWAATSGRENGIMSVMNYERLLVLFAALACGCSTSEPTNPVDSGGDVSNEAATDGPTDAGADTAIADGSFVCADAALCGPTQICLIPCCGNGLPDSCAPPPPVCVDAAAECTADASGPDCNCFYGPNLCIPGNSCEYSIQSNQVIGCNC